MPEQTYFQNALSSFTHDVASGGAIRHLTDLGYTVRQISERLDFPTPFARVQAEVWRRLLDTEIILLEEPGSTKKEKVSYVREYDSYGKPSFRRIVESAGSETTVSWKRRQLEDIERDAHVRLIREKMEENGENGSYVACDFGLLRHREPRRFLQLLQELEEEQREYVEGLPWERKRVYHQLNQRMTKIWMALHEEPGCFGECFFLKTGEVFCCSREV